MPSKKSASGAPATASPLLAARAAPSRVENPAGGVTSSCTCLHSDEPSRRNTCTAPALMLTMGAPTRRSLPSRASADPKPAGRRCESGAMVPADDQVVPSRR